MLIEEVWGNKEKKKKVSKMRAQPVCCVLTVWCVSVCRGVVSRRWWMRRALCLPAPSQLPHYQSFRMYCCSFSIHRPPHFVSLFLSHYCHFWNVSYLISVLYLILLSLPPISLPLCIFVLNVLAGETSVKLFKSSFLIHSGAWEWKRTSRVLQPRPSLLRAHPSWCLFPQYLHVHTDFPWWPGFWLPPAAPTFPQWWAVWWIRAQRAGCRKQCQDGGTLEAYEFVVSCDE